MEESGPLLCELAERLAELNLLDVFGMVRRNIRTIPIADDELLVETTDAAKRLLTLKPEFRSDGRFAHQRTEPVKADAKPR